MAVSMKTIVAEHSIPVFIAESSPPDVAGGAVPVLLFLHGKGEASPYLVELPKILFHFSPPFRALTNELRGVTVVAPQAPRLPDDGWNWREYVKEIGVFVRDMYPGRPKTAVGFSRGGLGVLQLMSAHPGLIGQWAIIDPQRAATPEEQAAITPRDADRASGWLRFGNQLTNNTPFSRHIASVLPPGNSHFIDLEHARLAHAAFSGDPLGGALNLYAHLGLRFERVAQ